jgi:hypothetical protein
MTKVQRERWNTKQVEKIRKNLRSTLQIFKHTSRSDKEEIENRVMTEMEAAVASVSDTSIHNCPLLISFESQADSLLMEILMEQDWHREMEWESLASASRPMPLAKTGVLEC